MTGRCWPRRGRGRDDRRGWGGRGARTVGPSGGGAGPIPRAADPGGPGPWPGQSARRPHRLQRGPGPADGHRPADEGHLHRERLGVHPALHRARLALGRVPDRRLLGRRRARCHHPWVGCPGRGGGQPGPAGARRHRQDHQFPAHRCGAGFERRLCGVVGRGLRGGRPAGRLRPPVPAGRGRGRDRRRTDGPDGGRRCPPGPRHAHRLLDPRVRPGGGARGRRGGRRPLGPGATARRHPLRGPAGRVRGGRPRARCPAGPGRAGGSARNPRPGPAPPDPPRGLRMRAGAGLRRRLRRRRSPGRRTGHDGEPPQLGPRLRMLDARG